MAKPIDLVARVLDRTSGSLRLGRLEDVVYHAQLVEESFRFAARELLDGPQPATYFPRGRSLSATIRHRTGDLYVLNEIVRHRAYDFPAEALRRLRALGRPPRVVDAGANIGLFGIEVFDRFPNATVTAFEPDPANAAVHEHTIHINARGGRWKLIRSCAGTADGTVTFAAEGGVGSHIDSAPGAISVPAVDLFPYLHEADLVKMDIEGAEWPILADERLQEVGDLVLVFEFHDEGCPFPDPRDAALRLLAASGFTAHEVKASCQPSGTGLVWAWT